MAKKSENDLNQMHWRDRYEYEAARKDQELSENSEGQLIYRIENDRVDPYFAIWRAIAKKGTVAGSAMTLWRFLQRSPGESLMLHRYHCANALFRIIGMADPASESELRKSVQWDVHGEEARQEALLELKRIIETQLVDDQSA